MSDEERRGLVKGSKRKTECREAVNDPQPRRILSRDELPEFGTYRMGLGNSTFRRVEIYDDEWYDTIFPPIKQDAESPDAADEQHNDQD
jgi:hypothetical protein